MTPEPLPKALTDWLALCAKTPELIREFDRLRGTNVQRKGPPINLAIDHATGRLEADTKEFAAFCFDLFLRIPSANS